MKTNSKKLSSEARKGILKCIVIELAFTAILLLSVVILISFCHQVIWYWEDPFYRIFKYFEEHITIIIISILFIGWIIITYKYISKFIGYINDVTKAAERLSEPTNEPIVLPGAMSYAENELNRAREKALSNARAAKDAEQRKNDLVVYLAHDLKTPLTSVIGYLTLLRDEGQISEELRQKYLSISLEKAERLEDLINEFFEITRFNLSEIDLEYSNVNLTRLLEQLVFEFKPMLMEKNLGCILDIAPNIYIKCDVDKIQRVFDNLLRNAVNYSFSNETIKISGAIENNYLNIKFENHGNTIPKEKLNRIFEQFFRLDSSRSTKNGGAGLGLAIAKEIVEHHGGEISAESSDETIVFKVSLPIS